MALCATKAALWPVRNFFNFVNADGSAERQCDELHALAATATVPPTLTFGLAQQLPRQSASVVDVLCARQKNEHVPGVQGVRSSVAATVRAMNRQHCLDGAAYVVSNRGLNVLHVHGKGPTLHRHDGHGGMEMDTSTGAADSDEGDAKEPVDAATTLRDVNAQFLRQLGMVGCFVAAFLTSLQSHR